MDKIQSKIKEEIKKIRTDISDITRQIQVFRNDNDVDNVGVGQELIDKLEMLNEKVLIMRKNLSIYQSSGSSKNISVGDTVEIKIKSANVNKTFTLVFPDDADSTEGYISVESPLGKALIGKREGEVVQLLTPAGTQEYIVNKRK